MVSFIRYITIHMKYQYIFACGLHLNKYKKKENSHKQRTDAHI